MNSLQTICQGQNIDFTKKHNHIRCLAHVINLAAQDALTVLKVGYFENDNEIYNQIDQNNEIGISGVIPKVRNYMLYIFKINLIINIFYFI
jgi:hypothetical protein